MDVLDDILTTLNLKGALYFRTDFSGEWGTTVPDLPGVARFHLVIQGECHVTLQSGETFLLRTGDLILIPGGGSHIIAYAPDHDAPPLETLLEDVAYDGSGVLAIGSGDENASTQLVCGHFSFQDNADHILLRSLPEALVTTPADRAREPMLDDTMRLVVKWIFSETPGSAAAVTRLSETIFIELLRLNVNDEKSVTSFLYALQDKQIGATLTLMHNHTKAPWTVESLAAEVGMSRSRFADRFRSLLGMSPMAYLSDWRLQKALSLLRDSHYSVQEIATSIGYQSPAAFTRAFSGKFGSSPTDHRRKLSE